MEDIKIQNDFSWVIKVLNSCIKEQQVLFTEKLFERFLEKWVEYISDEKKTRFSFIFEKARKGKIVEIRKNLSPLLHQTQFYLN